MNIETQENTQLGNLDRWWSDFGNIKDHWIKISENRQLGNLTLVYVKRTEKEMEAREEFHSLLWEQVSRVYAKSRIPVYLYKIPARDLKIGESIFDKKGKFIGHRLE